jgi:bifunctional polynucleotide phosphatase/kinase
MDWIETNSYLKGIVNTLDELPDPTRVAAFDLDDTLIHKPNKGKDGKWKLLDLALVDKIADLVERKYIIVIFTNQGGMSINKNFDKPKWRKAVDELIKVLAKGIENHQYYFAIYVSKNYDLYRKPNIGLWEQMKEDLKEEFKLDEKGIPLRISKKSFFCGDAAGRTVASQFKRKLYPSSKKGDFSDTDRKFALNIGIDFITPEEFFLEKAPKMSYELTGFNPKLFIENDLKEPTYEFKPRSKELIVMVGAPGSGKSEFVEKYIVPHGYVHINQDTCKTKTKCIKLTVEALEKKKSVVIDNTNPDVISRMTYTSLAQEHGYKHIRCIILNTDVELAKHLNNVRHVYSNGAIRKITDMVYNIFKKNYVKPLETEHFDSIEKVDFEFDPTYLDDPHWKKIFMRWSES